MDNRITYKSFFGHLLTEGNQCAMVDVPPTPTLSDFIRSIPDNIVYELNNPDYGKETHPHITILYGIEDGYESKAKGLLKSLPKKISVRLGKISKFNNPQFDVLKIDVHSEDLVKLNALLRKNVKFSSDHPNYVPHLTLAYLKKGTGEEFVGDDRFDGITLTLDTISYSDGATLERFKPTIGVNEAALGMGGGYGGAYGGPASPSGWAGTSSCPASSNRLDQHPLKRISFYMQGNTIINSEPYSSVTDDDLKHPTFPPQEMWAGLRYEMRKMEHPNKEEAKAIVIKNLQKNPKYYSDLDMYAAS